MVRNPYPQEEKVKTECVTYPMGSYVFEEGDENNFSMYFLLSGQVVVQKTVGSSLQTLTTLQPGDFFGETALLTKDVRKESIKVVSQRASFIVLNKFNFLSIIESELEIIFSIFKVAIIRFQKLELELSALIQKFPKTELQIIEKLYTPKLKVTNRDVMNTLDSLPHKVLKNKEALINSHLKPSYQMYYVLNGSLRCNKKFNSHNSLSIEYPTGKFFGESFLFSEQNNNLSIYANKNNTQLICIDEIAFLKISSLSSNFLFSQLKYVLWKLDTASKILTYIEDKVRYKLAHSDVKTYKQKSVVIKEQDPSNGSMYFILEGSCGVFKKQISKEKQLNTLYKGDFFGELAMVSDDNRNATIKVLSNNTQIIQLERSKFSQKTSKNPGFMLSILKAIIARVYRAEYLVYSKFTTLSQLSQVHQNKVALNRKHLLEIIQKLKHIEPQLYHQSDRLYTNSDFSLNRCLFLLEGEVRIVQKKGSTTTVFKTLQPGDLVSEIGLVGNFPLNSDCLVQSEVARVLSITKEGFANTIQEQADFLYGILSYEIWKLLTLEKTIIENNISYDIYNKEDR
jgi:CRP-like cAMP-binding protein